MFRQVLLSIKLDVASRCLNWLAKFTELAVVVGGLAACVGIQSVATSVPFIVEQSDWRVIPDSTKIQNAKYGVTLSVTPLNVRKESVRYFYVHLGSFQKAGNVIKIDLRRIKLVYAGKVLGGEGWSCAYPLKLERISRIKEYASSSGCALVTFPIEPPPIWANYTLIIEGVSVDGTSVELPSINFKEGIVRFGEGFQ